MNIDIFATGSKGNVTIIRDGSSGSSLMIDCGLSYKTIQKLTNYKISGCQACLITHEHIDHIRGIESVSERVKIAGTKETLAQIETKYKILWKKEVEKMKPTVFGTLEVIPFKVKHNAVDPVGYQITSLTTADKLVFVTDSQYIPYVFPDVKTMVVECNYSEALLRLNVESGKVHGKLANEIRNNHYSLDTLLKTIPHNTALERLYLIHPSERNLDIDEAVTKIKEVFDGEIIIGGRQ